MSKVLVNNQTLTDIANSIRTKKGSEETFKPSEMPSAIESIQSGKYAPRTKVTFEKYTGNELEYEILNLDTSNITDMSRMFADCSNLTNLDLTKFDTSNVTNMSWMFSMCSNLTDIDVSSFDLGKVTNISGFISNAKKMTNIKFGYDLGKAYVEKTDNYSSYTIALSFSSMLTRESILSTINGVYDLNLTYDVANGGTLYMQRMNLGAANLVKMTAEELAVATDKGWAVQ